MAIFGLFELLFFIAQKGVFSFQNIIKHIFLADIAEKKKLKKWPFLDQNHGLTSLEKYQFFHFLIFLFLQPRKAFFFVLEDRKRHFPGPFFLKKELEKWPFLYQNHGLTPLEKSHFFVFLNFFFIAQKGVFLFQNIAKHIFLAYFGKKKEFVKKPIFVQKPWINPFRKMAILRLFELLIFIAQKGVFSFQNVVKDIFPCLFRLKKRSWTNGHFQTKSLR